MKYKTLTDNALRQKFVVDEVSFYGHTDIKTTEHYYSGEIELTAKLMEQGLHALALHIYLPDEWQAIHGTSPESPNCMGGSKKTNH